jgi:hypothetical protein
VRPLESLGGRPRAFVPDQLKSGVTASRFEPTIQRTYEEGSQHDATTILPARPGKPRDKAKALGGVLIAQRWIVGRLRTVTCFSIAELNEQISPLLVELNSRVMTRVGELLAASWPEPFDASLYAALRRRAGDRRAPHTLIIHLSSANCARPVGHLDGRNDDGPDPKQIAKRDEHGRRRAWSLPR